MRLRLKVKVKVKMKVRMKGEDGSEGEGESEGDYSVVFRKPSLSLPSLLLLSLDFDRSKNITPQHKWIRKGVTLSCGVLWCPVSFSLVLWCLV